MIEFFSLVDLFYPASEDLALRKSDMRHKLDAFEHNLYKQRPIQDNEGGMGLEGSFMLQQVIEHLMPEVIFESGVWRGHTTYLFNAAPSVKKIWCFDPCVDTPNFIQYHSPKAAYFSIDWASTIVSSISINSDTTLAFFDDHQDQLERLLTAYQRGIRWVLFDDNYFYGGGGHAGLADHMRASNPILSHIANRIYIAPPLINPNKGIDPLFSSADLPPQTLSKLTQKETYEWLTLVEVKAPLQPTRSQLPDADYFEDFYSRRH